jgi:D-alanyl-D-alanine carboxypeptidase
LEAGPIVGYGHGGGGLGAGCLLLYVPAKKVYLFLAVNIGLVIEGPVGIKVDAMKNDILGVVLR